jgi:hypothetical protein
MNGTARDPDTSSLRLAGRPACSLYSLDDEGLLPEHFRDIRRDERSLKAGVVSTRLGRPPCALPALALQPCETREGEAPRVLLARRLAVVVLLKEVVSCVSITDYRTVRSCRGSGCAAPARTLGPRAAAESVKTQHGSFEVRAHTSQQRGPSSRDDRRRCARPESCGAGTIQGSTAQQFNIARARRRAALDRLDRCGVVNLLAHALGALWRFRLLHARECACECAAVVMLLAVHCGRDWKGRSQRLVLERSSLVDPHFGVALHRRARVGRRHGCAAAEGHRDTAAGAEDCTYFRARGARPICFMETVGHLLPCVRTRRMRILMLPSASCFSPTR